MKLDKEQIQNSYNRFKHVELTFNKDVIEATGLIPRENFLISGKSKWECQIHAVSFVTAKVLPWLSKTTPGYAVPRTVTSAL